MLCLILAVPSVAATSRRLPVDGGTVTSGIGWRPDPFGSGRMVYHRGVDIAVPEGTRVYPTQRGTVLYAGVYKGYGNLVAIDHGNGYVTLYGHNASLLVTPGQPVDMDTPIALSGNTGRSTGPHVHYEVRQLADSGRKARERMEEQLKALVAEKVEAWVEGYVAGKGEGDGGEAPRKDPLADLALPGDEVMQ
ncbi:MAG: M23 family metallopeptidase [Desulfuromonadales bacterium]|nr:MAG: M23 family metallopeptidase [Desulfuromonadales bacterium]